MSTYYKHTKRESYDIPYSFCCEQCMKESGTLQATIVGDQAEVNSSFRNLSDSNQERLDNLAHKYLVQAVKKAHTNATEKQIFVKAFKDECPHCHKPQSWAVSNAKKEMFTWPVVIVIAGIIAGVACYFVSDAENKGLVSIGIAAACFAVAAVWFIVCFAKFSNKKKQTSEVMQHNLPIIDWSAAQHLLDE